MKSGWKSSGLWFSSSICSITCISSLFAGDVAKTTKIPSRSPAIPALRHPLHRSDSGGDVTHCHWQRRYLTRVRRRWINRTSTITNKTPAMIRTIVSLGIDNSLPRKSSAIFSLSRRTAAAVSFCGAAVFGAAKPFAPGAYLTRLRRRCTRTTSTIANSTPAITRTIVAVAISPPLLAQQLSDRLSGRAIV